MRRRRLALAAALVVLAALVGVGAAVLPRLGDAAREIALPLRHEDIIRQQAREKDLDPALIAAVTYAESRFRDEVRSSAGAIGLMQVTPETASDIARRSGGTSFVTADLDVPQLNMSYGSFHLHYLLDRFDGDEAEAVAAYNAGEGNVDRWLAEGRTSGGDLDPDRIPFPETRAYVEKVLDARDRYRDEYPAELGLR